MALTILCVTFTLLLLLGVPVAFSIGLSSLATILYEGLPLAVQVVGRYFDEARILQVARAIERLTGWENQLLPDGT